MKRSEVRFIDDASFVEDIHAEGLEVGETPSSPGVRDRGLLESAVGAPRNALPYVQSLAELAGIYAYGIAKNHAFIDGNKRAAFYTMVAFLDGNGFLFSTAPLDTEAWIGLFDGLAAGRVTRDQLVDSIAAEIGKLQNAGGPIWVDFEPDDDER